MEAFGPSLGFPQSSAVQGFPGLRELRPRAQVDHRRFEKASRLAVARLAELEED